MYIYNLSYHNKHIIKMHIMYVCVKAGIEIIFALLCVTGGGGVFGTQEQVCGLVSRPSAESASVNERITHRIFRQLYKGISDTVIRLGNTNNLVT